MWIIRGRLIEVTIPSILVTFVPLSKSKRFYRPSGKIILDGQPSDAQTSLQKARDVATLFTRPVAAQIFRSRPDSGAGSAVDTSHVLGGLDALDSIGQGNSLAGDQEGLTPGLVILQRTINRNDEQQLDHSCNQLPCCCRPAFGSVPGVMLLEAKAAQTYLASFSLEERQAVCGILKNCLPNETDEKQISTDSEERVDYEARSLGWNARDGIFGWNDRDEIPGWNDRHGIPIWKASDEIPVMEHQAWNARYAFLLGIWGARCLRSLSSSVALTYIFAFWMV
ncbi:hypothetical protein Nepgr_032764 [Nepenthes gracilis]|uniref:Uncharacterized protein n=1 Tax=Nepenthes gracilis TaxID=150966 RepID=A0AAD3TKU9_NEPGR|nr:hypothetical protein Nepgr_032764 [Nepenthes gracilis]